MTGTNHSKQADAIPALDVPAGSAAFGRVVAFDRQPEGTLVTVQISRFCDSGISIGLPVALDWRNPRADSAQQNGA